MHINEELQIKEDKKKDKRELPQYTNSTPFKT